MRRILREQSLTLFFGTIFLAVAAVTFIDSMGLRALLWAAEHQDGHRLGVRCGPGAVRRMIEMTGMERSLPLIA